MFTLKRKHLQGNAKRNDMFPYSVIPVNSLQYKNHFRETWLQTWLEEGYAQTDSIVEKYAKYDSFSDDFLLTKQEQPIGTLRIVKQNDVVGLPVLDDFSIDNSFNITEELCEATLLTVKKSERQSDYVPSLLLLIQLWQYVRQKNIPGIVIAADVRLWFLLRRKLELSFHKIGQEKIYEGSITVPGYLNVREQKERAMKSPLKNILWQALREI